MKTVTLTTCKDNVQAHMLQDILKNEGIESIVHSELTSQVLSPLYNIGVDVLVFEDDFERAEAVLKESFPELV